jgi:hypothetical protein
MLWRPRSSCVLALPFCLLLACSEQSSTDSSVGDSVQALKGAQSSYVGFNQTAATCFETFKTCVSTSEIGATECRTALLTCLPTRSPVPPDCISNVDAGATGGAAPVVYLECHTGNKGTGGSGVGGGTQAYPGGSDAGVPPGRWCEDVPTPTSSAITSCREEFDTCIQSGVWETCKGQFVACGKTAFTTSFQSACTRATSECSSSSGQGQTDLCGQVTKVCAQGVDTTQDK